MPKRKRGLKTDEIQKVLADLEDEIFDDSDSDCELENEEDDLISAQQNKLLDSFPDGFEVERRHDVCVSHKPSGILLVEDNSKIFYSSGPWNRVVLDVDLRWFSCVASCGEEDCFSFRRVYGDFPFVIPVL
ncbi:hypothetical protein TNCV_3106041 [Trichonephila clavipes]|nr:hypothetical protein TNCV_3106041 [Trichonephila clavipes]